MSDSWMNDLDTYVYKHSLCTRFYIVQVTMWPWLLFISSKRVCKNLCAKTAICSGDWTVLWEMHLWTSNFLSSSVIIPNCPWKNIFSHIFQLFWEDWPRMTKTEIFLISLVRVKCFLLVSNLISKFAIFASPVSILIWKTNM